jgi:hypothetical protein
MLNHLLTIKIYSLAWYTDFLMPPILMAVLALLISPRARNIMFPPAPLALVDYSNGGLLKPHAGLLATTDTITGAPENVKGEAAENEASNFVTGIAAIAVNVLTDKDPQHDDDQKSGRLANALPDPNTLATKVAVVKDKASGVDRPSQDKSKAPMEEVMWSKVRPMMHGICAVSDMWERCAKYVSPLKTRCAC